MPPSALGIELSKYPQHVSCGHYCPQMTICFLTTVNSEVPSEWPFNCNDSHRSFSVVVVSANWNKLCLVLYVYCAIYLNVLPC